MFGEANQMEKKLPVRRFFKVAWSELGALHQYKNL